MLSEKVGYSLNCVGIIFIVAIYLCYYYAKPINTTYQQATVERFLSCFDKYCVHKVKTDSGSTQWRTQVELTNLARGTILFKRCHDNTCDELALNYKR